VPSRPATSRRLLVGAPCTGPAATAVAILAVALVLVALVACPAGSAQAVGSAPAARAQDAPPNTVADTVAVPPGSGVPAGTDTTVEPGPVDTAPIPLPAAAVPVSDDPRVAPELASLAVDSPEYRDATATFQATSARRDDALAQHTDALGRIDRADAELAQLASTRPQVAGQLVVAQREAAKAQRLLDQSRDSLRGVTVAVYVAGGLGRSPEEDLEVSRANDVSTQRIMVESVTHQRLDEQARYVQAVADLTATSQSLVAELAELDRRAVAATGARDQAVGDRDRAQALADQLAATLVDERKAVGDARLAADVPELGMSFVVLNAYVRAADAMALVDPACGIRWPLLAGIGRSETNHGTFGGATVGPDGKESTPIYGPLLDGSNGFAKVGDTDGGALDGDPNFDRAVGPMQFIPGTWKRWARDGDGDGKTDPQDYYDATLTAATYLCLKGPGLDADPGMARAIRSYNDDGSYVSLVEERSGGYARYQFPPAPPAPPPSSPPPSSPPPSSPPAEAAK
jgi:membrane-bound lytic murein transglycosylase B